MKKNGIFSSIGTIKQIKDGYSIDRKTLSGIIRIETEDCATALFASFINFKALECEEYKLFIVNSKKQIKTVDLSMRPLALTKTFEDFSIDEEGFSAGIFVVGAEVPLLVAVSKTENNLLDATELKKLIYERYACIHKNKARKEAKNLTVSKECDFKPLEVGEKYDDEVVATENYYLKEKTTGEGIGEKTCENLPNENVEFNTKNETKKEETPARSIIVEDENDTCSKTTRGENLTYYERTKRELDEVFSRFPEEENLAKIFSNSKWCKVYYEEEKYYVVGLIKENQKEKYICYGVPEYYSQTPPKELKGYCCFIPLSIFDLTGKGYWMMFQDAVTGAPRKSNTN